MILELVGAPNLTANLEALAIGGRIGVIGVGAGAQTEIDLRALMGKRALLRGSTLRARPIEEKAITARLWRRWCCPASRPATSRCPSPRPTRSKTRGRLRALQGGGKLGKIVLEM